MRCLLSRAAPRIPKSAGCLHLIKKDKARLITSAEDVVEWLEWSTKAQPPKAVQKQLFVALSEEEQQLYLAIKEEINLDELALLKGWPISKNRNFINANGTQRSHTLVRRETLRKNLVPNFSAYAPQVLCATCRAFSAPLVRAMVTSAGFSW